MTQPRKDIQITHRFSASAERVYDAWLDPAYATQFMFATDNGTIVRCDIDAKVGGTFNIADRRNGEDILHTGTYLELTRPSRIKFSFAVPKYSSEAAIVTIDIVPDGNGCLLTLTQAGTLPEYEERTIQGWTKMLQKADRAIG